MTGRISATFADILQRAAPLARAGLRRLDAAEMVAKAARDYQTAADRAVERAVARDLAEAFPDWRIEGEEFGAAGAADPDAPLLLIDPIDGTTNYAWGIPHFGMVVTLWDGGRVTAGAVLDPMLDEMFTADRGAGAAMNGAPLRVASPVAPEAALIGAGLPVPGQVVSVTPGAYAGALERAMAVTSGVRRLGSAALSIAYVAAGRFDGFFEDGLGLGDFGASALMVTEAGGVVTDFHGQPVGPRCGIVAASGPDMHLWLRQGLASAA
jgi:myo-inositol-1(or 4)-monophosphatase